MNIELQEDKDLDNRRVPVDFYLFHLRFVVGDEKIAIEKRHYNKRSGWCLDASDKGWSVSINKIGELIHFSNSARGWEIYCYEHKYGEALEKIEAEMRGYKKRTIELADSIPVNV